MKINILIINKRSIQNKLNIDKMNSTQKHLKKKKLKNKNIILIYQLKKKQKKQSKIPSQIRHLLMIICFKTALMTKIWN